MSKSPTRDDVLRRLLKMPPKPHAQEKHPRTTKAKAIKAKAISATKSKRKADDDTGGRAS